MSFQAPYTAADEVAAQTYFDDVMANRTPRISMTDGVNTLLCVTALNDPQFADSLLYRIRSARQHAQGFLFIW